MTDGGPRASIEANADGEGPTDTDVDQRAELIEIDLRGSDPHLRVVPVQDAAITDDRVAAERTPLVPSPLPLPEAPMLRRLTIKGERGRRSGSIYRFTKRSADVVTATVLVLLLLPVIVIAALLVRFTSRGPIFYRHTRHGRNGNRFQMIKLRSMVAGADQRLREMEGLAAEGVVEAVDEPVFKARHDPRITKVGRVLRRANIDELPQLWNVIRGDMSLVGPRPLVEKEVETLSDDEDQLRHSVRPGITCLWQVGRTEQTTFAERMGLDLLYVGNRSATLDVVLLLMTPIAVLGGARSH